MMLWFMVVITTAIRAGGVNAGDNPTTYDPEKNSSLRLWLKKHSYGWSHAYLI